MSTTNIDDIVAARVADTIKKQRKAINEGAADAGAEAAKTLVNAYADDYDGVPFSEAFGMAPPKGMPDLKCVIYKDEDWDESDRKWIPEKSKFVTYVPNPKVLYQLWTTVHRMNMNALVVGPTGSGKTTTQEFFCSVIRQPYFRINGRGDMESDTILGKPWVDGGSMQFEIGSMVQAAIKGYWIAFDEPWKVPSPIQMALQRFYENEKVFQLDDMPGEIGDKLIKAEPRCRLVLADNVVGTGDNMDQYAATMIQDGATLNRMDVVIFQPYMDKKLEIKMVKEHCPNLTESTIERMLSFITLCRTSFEQRAISAAMSPRNLLRWAELTEHLGDVNTACAMVVSHRYSDDTERSVVEGHFRTTFDENLKHI